MGSLKIQVREADTLAGKVFILEPSENMDGEQYGQAFRSQINELLDKGHRRFIINWRQISELNKNAVAELIAVWSRIAKVEGQLRLSNLNAKAEDQLRIANLLPIFETYSSDQAALASFSS